MNTPEARECSRSTLVLKTNIFNDQDFAVNSLQIDLSSNEIVVDISDQSNAGFTDADWDYILNSILSSSKVITV